MRSRLCERVLGLCFLGHVSALVHAALEGVNTRLRGIHIVLLAFLQARFTDVGADFSVLLVEFGVARAQAGTLVGDIGGVPAQSDTARQILISSFDTLVGTPITDLGYFETRVDTLLHLIADVHCFG